jgi:hypothetical protein
LFLFALALPAQNALKFEVDPPGRSLCRRDGSRGRWAACARIRTIIVIVNRRNITAEEAETRSRRLSIIMFDNTGKVIASIDPDKVRTRFTAAR